MQTATPITELKSQLARDNRLIDVVRDGRQAYLTLRHFVFSSYSVWLGDLASNR